MHEESPRTLGSTSNTRIYIGVYDSRKIDTLTLTASSDSVGMLNEGAIIYFWCNVGYIDELNPICNIQGNANAKRSI